MASRFFYPPPRPLSTASGRVPYKGQLRPVPPMTGALCHVGVYSAGSSLEPFPQIASIPVASETGLEMAVMRVDEAEQRRAERLHQTTRMKMNMERMCNPEPTWTLPVQEEDVDAEGDVVSLEEWEQAGREHSVKMEVEGDVRLVDTDDERSVVSYASWEGSSQDPSPSRMVPQEWSEFERDWAAIKFRAMSREDSVDEGSVASYASCDRYRREWSHTTGDHASARRWQ